MAIALLTGCAATDHVFLNSDARVNMCEGADPHPVLVRIYHLRGTDRFDQAEFTLLWEDEQAALGPTFLRREQQVVNPRESLKISIPRKDEAEEATHLGFVANFCDLSGDCWRVSAPVSGRKTEIHLDLEMTCIEVSAP